MRRIQVINYDPVWPDCFKVERNLLMDALGTVAMDVHHIGSTAVPGLAAKPIIDILLEVTDLSSLDALNDEMEAIGYEPMGEYGIPGRRYFRKGGDKRTHHIHAFNAGSPHVQRHIAFRDYLVSHPEDAKQYEELKIRCAAECKNDSNKYCDGKEEFISELEKKAIAWMKCQ